MNLKKQAEYYEPIIINMNIYGRSVLILSECMVSPSIISDCIQVISYIIQSRHTPMSSFNSEKSEKADKKDIPGHSLERICRAVFACSAQLSMNFFLLINVKMPAIVTFMSGNKIAF